MKISVLVFLFLPIVAFSQVKIQGGVFFATNSKTSLIGLPGPKIGVPFSVGERLSGEFAILGVPGFFLERDSNRLGLSLGPVVSFSKKGNKQKVMVGVMFFKSGVWYGIPGLGIQF